jgi:hypothetical protein
MIGGPPAGHAVAVDPHVKVARRTMRHDRHGLKTARCQERRETHAVEVLVCPIGVGWLAVGFQVEPTEAMRRARVGAILPYIGNFWLTARLTGVAGRPVLSQRFVRAFRSPVVPDAVKQRTFVGLGGVDGARALFEAWGLRQSEGFGAWSPQTHAVVIWNATHLSETETDAVGA